MQSAGLASRSHATPARSARRSAAYLRTSSSSSGVLAYEALLTYERLFRRIASAKSGARNAGSGTRSASRPRRGAARLTAAQAE